MREIKVRAWTDQGTKGKFRMEYNIGVLPDNIDAEWVENGFGLFFKNKTRHILMQYTGLKDKNDKEIYEGNIISDGDTAKGNRVVVFENGQFNAPLIIEDWAIGRNNIRLNHFFMENGVLYEHYQIRIIGNIYEDKDLLK